MNPEYFLYRMAWWEVNRYIAGINRRKRTAWETTREIEWMLASIHWDRKKSAPPKSAKELMQFSWEKDEVQVPQVTEDDIREMQERMENYQF